MPEPMITLHKHGLHADLLFFHVQLRGGRHVSYMYAGSLGEKETAAHAALLSLCIFCFNAFPFAVSIAGTIRVGNLLGEGRARQVRNRTQVYVLTKREREELQFR